MYRVFQYVQVSRTRRKGYGHTAGGFPENPPMFSNAADPFRALDRHL